MRKRVVVSLLCAFLLFSSECKAIGAVDLSLVPIQKNQASPIGVELGVMYVVAPDIVLETYGVPDGEGVCQSSKKTYMGYDAVTNKRSDQYKLLNSDECYTCPITGIRMIGDRYCIAMGFGYVTKIGTKVNLIMESGAVVKCIIGDFKATEHTDETRRYQKYDGSVAEMIVDYSVFKSTKQYPEELKGRIARVEIVEERE